MQLNNKIPLQQLTYFRLLKLQFVLFLYGIVVSQKKLLQIAQKQVNKGIEKYGTNIVDCEYNKHNWIEMSLEEIIDFLFYVIKNDSK